MKKTIRYGQYLGAVGARQHVISFNHIVAAERSFMRRQRLRFKDIYRLLAPYVSVRFIDQFKAVVPLALFLVLFTALVLRTVVADAWVIGAGIFSVILGLMLFLEGIQHGLMPFSENIGFNLPSQATTPVILAVAFILGVAATFAEPAISALHTAGRLIDPVRAPRLASLLNQHGAALVGAVGASVGLAVMLGILRMVMNWRLKTVIVIALLPCLGVAAYMAAIPELASVLALAWDCGAITTGPVTVPMVLALGIGVTAAAGSEDNALSGFGIVTLASMFPVMAVMLLALALPAPDAAQVAATLAATAAPLWYEVSPASDIIAALRAILPLMLLLWVLQRGLLKQGVANANILAYGIALSVIGMSFFSFGLTHGLAALGNHTGALLPAAFAPDASVPESPLYPYWIGVILVVFFATALGFGATMAEPALNAMGITVQNLTDGAFPRQLLIRSVAVGVGLGTAAGVVKVVFNLPIASLLLPAYIAALAMTMASSELYVNLAWDAAGVTTGPVTVPLVLTMGLGLGEVVHAAEGFGILALASVGPILSVLGVGLWIRLRIASSHAAAAQDETP